MKKVIFLPFFFVCFWVNAQSDSVWRTSPEVSIGGYLDVFYAFDFNKPPTNEKRQSFFYNYNRQNQINLNLAYFKAAVKHAKYRANTVLQVGTYSVDNYANEPNFLKNIYEANAGFSLNRKNNWWIDGGILPSHIGFESAESYDCWTLTRSLLAENSPYYELGAKLTYNPTSKWEAAALILNGWQRIYVQKNHLLPSFGTQLKFTPNSNSLLNWSTFVGSNDADNARKIRFFNNFFGQFFIVKNVGIIAGFDIGIQQTAKAVNRFDCWFSPVVIVRCQVHEKVALALRGEYYYDPKNVMISTVSGTSFRTSGLSLNIDYKPIPIIALRAEARWLHAQNTIFERPNSTSKNDVFIVLSAAVKYMRAVSRKR